MAQKDTRRKTTDPRIDGSADNLARIAAAKHLFMDSAINMGWQLAVTIIVPIYIGVRLDDRFASSPKWTLVALFLAIVMSCAVVWKAVQGASVSHTIIKKGEKPSAK